jgi:hypothetical protein
MTLKLNRLLNLLALCLVVLGIAVPLPQASAQGAPDFFLAPSQVSNTVSTTVIIYGANVDWGSGTSPVPAVLVEGIGTVASARVSSTVLTADLPAGLPAGSYAVTIIHPNSAIPPLTKAGALTIVGPTSTPGPTAFVRPVLVVQSYGASSATIAPGSNLDFEMTFVNAGQGQATNIVATFVTGDFSPRVTGGVRAVRSLGPGETERIFQPLTAARSIAGNSVATLQVEVAYTDLNGTAYSETFALTFPVAVPQGPGATRTPTPTPTATPTQRAALRPQLLITAYHTDVERLQPGTQFRLHLDIQNLGAADARRVTLIAGGGTAGDPSGTPGPGGVSGGGGDFTNFAPIGASNVQSLGDVAAGASLSAEQTFVVNATTDAGAYPMEFSFVYSSDSGAYTDDQVITLLVYQLPQVDVSLYRDPGPFFTFQPNILPLQIVNLGRNTSVLGNMRVAGEGAEFANNVILVGNLDPGGFFTLDATVIPQQPGPLELLVTVDYTDDFNQQRTITDTVTVEVIEAPVIEPGDGGGPIEPPPPEPETLWQKILRFVRGLLGLDSSPPGNGGGEFPPVEQEVVPGEDGVPVKPLP